MKAIWSWLQKNEGSVIYFSPGNIPQTYTHWQDVPYDGPKEVDFYSSLKWKKLRHKALEVYGNKCSCCGSVADLQVDHIKPRSHYPELALELDNLQILCKLCNQGKSNLSEKKWRK